MEIKATGKYIRVSPFKAHKVASLIQGKSVDEAINILKLTTKKSSGIIDNILQSAIANAKNQYGLSQESLFVKRAQVDKGPTMKRIKPRARGRADLMRRRTSHITIVLDTIGKY